MIIEFEYDIQDKIFVDLNFLWYSVSETGLW